MPRPVWSSEASILAEYGGFKLQMLQICGYLPIKIGDSTVKIPYRSLVWPSLLSEAYRSSYDLVQWYANHQLIIRCLVRCSHSLFDPSIILGSKQTRLQMLRSTAKWSWCPVAQKTYILHGEKDEKGWRWSLGVLCRLWCWSFQGRAGKWLDQSAIFCLQIEVRTVQAPPLAPATSRVRGQWFGGLYPWLPESG